MKVNYKYKGVQVMLIDTKDGILDIRITEAVNGKYFPAKNGNYFPALSGK